MDGTTIESGYFAGADYGLLENKVDFFKRRVKEGVTVELITWSPNR